MSHKPWSLSYQLKRLAMGAKLLKSTTRGIICRECKTVRSITNDISGWKRNREGYLLCPECKELEK